MKRTKFYLLLFILFFLGFKAQGHSQNMLQPGNQWIFEILVWSWVHFAYIDTTIETITVGTDTIINNLTYSILTFSRVPACLNAEGIEYLRSDGNKIYRFNTDLQQELLMIDYDETVGYELIFEGYGDIDTGIVIIDSFGLEQTPDGTIVEVQYMRIFNNQSYDDETQYKVYKDIGFIQPGLLFPDVGTGLCDAGNGLQFRCFVSGQDTIHFTEYDCYELPLINSSQDAMKNSLKLFPNPANNHIIIPAGFTFKDMLNQNGNPITPSHNEHVIYLSKIPSGYYILRFISSDGGEVYVGKIIKN